jgi:hypothetical protein
MAIIEVKELTKKYGQAALSSPPSPMSHYP